MVIHIKPESFNWLDAIKIALKKHKIDKRETILIFQDSRTNYNGIVGLYKSIRRETLGAGLR